MEGGVEPAVSTVAATWRDDGAAEPRNTLGIERLALWAAPLVAVMAGVAAQWLDFRALRYPLLALVLAGVLVTAIAAARGRRGLRVAAATVLLGAATWAAAETLYVALHLAAGERFDAPRFGPQWRQALGLIAVHGGVLGVPTGLVATALMHVPLPFAPRR